MKKVSPIYRNIMGAVALALILGGCALRQGAAPAFTGSATTAVNPQLPPAEARPDANARAETQARDQIMLQASKMRLPDGRTLEDVAVTDTAVRGQLYDTVRDAHVIVRNVTEEGVVTVKLSLEQSGVQQIIDGYQQRGGK